MMTVDELKKVPFDTMVYIEVNNTWFRRSYFGIVEDDKGDPVKIGVVAIKNDPVRVTHYVNTNVDGHEKFQAPDGVIVVPLEQVALAPSNRLMYEARADDDSKGSIVVEEGG
jgi:hypothetical protein